MINVTKNRNIRLWIYVLAFILLPLLFTNCASKKVTLGKTNRITVASDKDNSDRSRKGWQGSDQENFKEHVVQQGESISMIAMQYKVTVDSIVELKNIENADFIKVGQKLLIPGQESPSK